MRLASKARVAGARSTIASQDDTTSSGAEPKPPPRSNYKIILRVRGGFNCTEIHPCVLRQIILKAAALHISDHTNDDEIRINTVNHTVLISRPDVNHGDLYYNIKKLQFNCAPYEVATQVADPADTC
ncbi:hypothetical protein HPB50_006295 [Hyalomma asiaticum]|uniref:Uncharacterized protein n=1 Tax=Hyalomma asiaticum TaxID=266040 RepID=A0ACB7SEW9_HYAAI|nr:hypothetical protein HPB50_006295 [Hyalomma asiaticum]